ncbi:MAG: hypothetical protein ACPGXZ_03300 [Saprospiraceae bacterium]
MKSTFTYIFLFISLSINAQTFINSPFQSNYIDNSARLSAIDIFGNWNYDGIGKGFFIKEMPNTFIGSHFANQVPRDIYNPLFSNLKLLNKSAGTPLELQIQGSQQGEGQARLGSAWSKKVKKTNWSYNTLADGYSYQGNLDRNKDDFLDLENRQKLIASHSMGVDIGRFSMSIQGHYVNSEMTGGSTAFNKETDFLTQNHYGYGHEITNAGFAANSSLRLSASDAKTYRNLRLNANGLRHNEANFYGQKTLNGQEDFLNGSLEYYQKSILSSFSIGGAYRSQAIESTFQTPVSPLDTIQYNIDRWSGFMSFDTYLNGKLQIKSGLRVDYENEQLEWFPRIQLVFRASGKYAKDSEVGYLGIFASREKRLSLGHFEYKDYLNSSRSFGFNRFDDIYDRGWVTGAAYTVQKFQFEVPGMWVPIQFFDTKAVWRTIILEESTQAKVTPNTELGAGSVVFERNENAWATSLLELSTRVRLQRFNGTFLFRVNDIGRKDIYLVPRTTIAITGSYRFEYGVSASLGWFHQGRQRLDDGSKTIRNNRWDARCSFKLDEIWENYFSNNATFLLGVNNVGDSRQQAIASGVDNPFGDNFDAANVWGNQVGFQFYGGLRFSF